MSPEHITQLILEYRYWILIPLTFLEGPIVAFVAGTLAAAGYFNIYILGALFFVRDVGLDGVYYALGYFGGRTAFAKRMLAKIGVTEEHLDQVHNLWTHYPGRTMFFGKLSYGVASAFVVVAGTVKMPLSKFFGWGAIVAIAQYGTLLLLGYFLGSVFGGTIEGILNNLEYILLAGGVALIGYYIFTFYMRGKFFEEEKEVGKEGIAE